MKLSECIEQIEKTDLPRKMKNSLLAILLVRDGDLSFKQKGNKVFLDSKLKTVDITLVISESGITTEYKEKVVKSETKEKTEEKS